MMHWKTKAFLQRASDLVPGGEALDSVWQRRVLHTLPVDESTFRATVGRAGRHVIGDLATRNSLVTLELATAW